MGMYGEKNFFLISHYRKKQHLQCYTKQCKIALFGTNTCSFKYIKMTLIVLIDLTLIDVQIYNVEIENFHLHIFCQTKNVILFVVEVSTISNHISILLNVCLNTEKKT